ncbi:hypothetical protein C8R43DRAFT_997269 [Mycena crocata]|nr:hypothetical protein C8R43DRAFT_997269 [Mycena crocata]
MALFQSADLPDALAAASRIVRTLTNLESSTDNLDSESAGSAGETVQSFILANNTGVVGLKEKLTTLRQVAECLSLRCDELEHEINRTLVSPISQIPPEILCYIFTLALPPLAVYSPSIPINGRRRWHEPWDLAGPWLFGKVCQHWRTLALSFPGLWSSLLPSTTMSPRQSFLLNQQLVRSGQAPLDILLRFTSGGNRREAFDRFLHKLVGESHRWRTVHFELDAGWRPHSEFIARELRFPLLREVVFSGRGVPHIKNYDFFRAAPNLRRVVLGNPRDVSMRQIQLPWAQLTTYKATYRDPSTHLGILSQAVNLVECDIGFPTDSMDEQIQLSGTVTLPHLRRLVVTNDVFLNCLITPALTDLYIQGTVVRALPFLHRSECVLTRLTLFMCDASDADIFPILRAAPAITTLAIDFAGKSSASDAIIFALTVPSAYRLCPNLTSLSWGDRNDGINREAFVDMVESRWRVPRHGVYRQLRFVGIYLQRLGMKANGRRLETFAEAMDVVILNAHKGTLVMERWRDY